MHELFVWNCSSSRAQPTLSRIVIATLSLRLPLISLIQLHLAVSPTMNGFYFDDDNDDDDTTASDVWDDEILRIRRMLMPQATRKVKGQRIRPRKPRNEAVDPQGAQLPNDSAFMKLPAELRNLIYELVILEWRREWAPRRKIRKTDPNANNKRPREVIYTLVGQEVGVEPGQWPEPGLLFMSKQIRCEARPLYYGLTKFTVFAKPRQLGALTSTLDRISNSLSPAPEGKRPIEYLQLSVIEWRWSDVRHLLELARLSIKHPTTLNSGRTPLSYLTREVHELGLRGGREEWTDEWLEFEFEELIRELPGTKSHREAIDLDARRSHGLEPYIRKCWSRLPDYVDLPGDIYGTNDEDEKDGDFKRCRRNVPASDRKLRSMS